MEQGNQIFGKRIRFFRCAFLELSMNEFSAAIGENEHTIKAIENGNLKPSINLIEKLIATYPVDLNWLFGHDGYLRPIELKTKSEESGEEVFWTSPFNNEQFKELYQKYMFREIGKYEFASKLCVSVPVVEKMIQVYTAPKHKV